MNLSDAPTQVLTAIESLLAVFERLIAIVHKLKLLRPDPLPYSYENLRLYLALDLQDARGRRAIINRTQRVHFLTEEAGVLTCPVWGEGTQLKRLALQGATKLGLRPGGSRRYLLLGLGRPAKRGGRFTVQARETLANAFLRSDEYLEAVVERPTRRLRLEVVFPKGRPPSQAHMVSGDVDERLRVRVGKDARARVSWRQVRPAVGSLYSLRWSW